MSDTSAEPPGPTADQLAVIEWAKTVDSVLPDGFATTVAVLRSRYGHKYVIRRNGRLWVATDVDPDTETAPTIIEETLTRFVAALENPGPRAGNPFNHQTE
ncbi:hypothetical protein [Nocardiopsis sp. FIRDI 009]|uniref:hypothetical protein n=1 Tax=Nocardiopsis sp. FIRDI 009 TaxID=714197 RepID=UPI001E5AFE35|nr:hypothetical protein [Nocardiopsis sp. FIRDI 009]